MGRKSRVLPLPELIVADAVTIKDGTGSMDNKGKVMRVPLGNTPRARHVRAHEMAHAKYSPDAPLVDAEIHSHAIQRCEDMRMNQLCRRQGLDDAMDAPILDGDEKGSEMLESLVSGPLASGDELSAVTSAVATYDTGDYPHVMDAIRSIDSEFADKVETFVSDMYDGLSDKEFPTYDDTVENARRCMEFISDDSELPPEPKPGEGDGEGDPRPVDMSSDPMDEMVDEAIESDAAADAPPDPVEDPLDEMREMKRHYAHRKHVAQPPMEIVTPILTERLAPSKLKSRTAVPADIGRVPRYMGRYCSDRAVFAGRGKRRDRGGVMVIDTSGSMYLNDADIDRIMEIVPMGTIATYAGRSDRGYLHIIARKGKRVAHGSALKPHCGGNIVDVPALEWMVKQDGPYYWLCDGIVTGLSDQSGENIWDRCIELCEKHRIVRAGDVESMLRVLGVE